MVFLQVFVNRTKFSLCQEGACVKPDPGYIFESRWSGCQRIPRIILKNILAILIQTPNPCSAKSQIKTMQWSQKDEPTKKILNNVSIYANKKI